MWLFFLGYTFFVKPFLFIQPKVPLQETMQNIPETTQKVEEIIQSGIKEPEIIIKEEVFSGLTTIETEQLSVITKIKNSAGINYIEYLNLISIYNSHFIEGNKIPKMDNTILSTNIINPLVEKKLLNKQKIIQINE